MLDHYARNPLVRPRTIKRSEIELLTDAYGGYIVDAIREQDNKPVKIQLAVEVDEDTGYTMVIFGGEVEDHGGVWVLT